jgi:hypothetical protein
MNRVLCALRRGAPGHLQAKLSSCEGQPHDGSEKDCQRSSSSDRQHEHWQSLLLGARTRYDRLVSLRHEEA